MDNSTIPTTTNQAWGFYGIIGHHAAADTAWPIAITAISGATTLPATTVQEFLDSRHGRHLANDVANELITRKGLADAINAATRRWLGWTIGVRTSRETGIPRRLPYLTGYAIHAEIEADSRD